MLTLNMSKELLSANGLMKQKRTATNEAAEQRNNAFVASLEVKASEQPEKYQKLKADAAQIHVLAEGLDAHIEDLKSKMVATVDDPTDYEVMDKGDYLDQHFLDRKSVV